MKAIKAVLAGLTVFALFGVDIASASVTPTNMLVNGDVHGRVPSGDVVNLTFQEINTGVSTWQSAWVEIPGSGFPGECVAADPNQNQIGAHSVNLNLSTLGTTEGDWEVDVTPYGFNRVTTGSQPTDVDCTQLQGPMHKFKSQLHIDNPLSTGNTSNNTANGGVNGGNNTSGTGVNNGNTNTSNGGSNASSTPPVWFTQWLAQWEANHPSTPPSGALCSAFKADLLASTPQARTPNNAVLQGFLIGALRSASNPTPIPALAMGATFGFFGLQTAAAVALFQSTNNCQ